MYVLLVLRTTFEAFPFRKWGIFYIFLLSFHYALSCLSNPSIVDTLRFNC